MFCSHAQTLLNVFMSSLSLHLLLLVHVIRTGCFGLGRKASGFTTHRHGSTLTNFLKTKCSPSSTSTVNNRRTYTHKSYSRTLGRPYVLLTTRGHCSFCKSQPRLFKTFKFFSFTHTIPLEVGNGASRCPLVCIRVWVIFTG